MAQSGTLEKMLVLAFLTAQDASQGGRQQAAREFEVLINPESYTLEHTLELAKQQGQGTGGTELVYLYSPPQGLTLDFLFDASGIIDGDAKPEGIQKDVDDFRSVLVGFEGEAHQTYHLKLVWGDAIFTGRAASVSTLYKLFRPDGKPLRAVMTVQFVSSIADARRRAEEAKESPDLTHQRTVRPGDTLPGLCHRVYGDPRHYLRVAEANGLDDFRTLRVGSSLLFPRLSAQERTP